MPFCATCGAPVEGRFCAKCGSSVAAGAAPAGSAPSGAGPQPIGVAAPMADNLASTLCYALGFITGILFLVLAPYNQSKAIRFHAFQSIFLCVGVILIRIVLSILLGMMFFAGGGFTIAFGISSLYSVACICVWLYMLISTYQGKTVVLPIIGPIAQQQA
ncbi:MAG: hypothetical protein LAQ69_29055 [Acidobacteriia bacterium]|nr:hypothetical protein [Terriglobia bacterium]